MSMPGIDIIDVDPKSITKERLANIIEGVVYVRRNTWLSTYPNIQEGITEEDINNCFVPLEEECENKLINILDNQTNRHLFVAEDSNIIIGFCYPTIVDNEHKIEAIYLLPEYQRKGIGKVLFKKALDWHGSNVNIELEVVAWNKNALNFYKNFDFVKTGESKFWLNRLNPPKYLPTIKMVRVKKD